MPKAYYGRIAIDFAGTKDEAKLFAKENGLGLAKSVSEFASKEMPTLVKPFTSRKQFEDARVQLEILGWPLEAQLIHFQPAYRRI